MAVQRRSRSIQFTAAGDTVAGNPVLALQQLTFAGTGLTAGQQLTVLDGNGDIVADYVVEAAIDNAELLPNPRLVRGLTILNVTLSGAWKLTAMLH
jgi:hypothetical protein